MRPHRYRHVLLIPMAYKFPTIPRVCFFQAQKAFLSMIKIFFPPVGLISAISYLNWLIIAQQPAPRTISRVINEGFLRVSWISPAEEVRGWAKQLVAESYINSIFITIHRSILLYQRLLTSCEFVRRRMDRNVPLSADDRNRCSVDGFIIAGRREFPMFVYLAMVNEHEEAHEGRGHWERLVPTECHTYQSLPSGSSIGAHHSRICSGAKGKQKGINFHLHAYIDLDNCFLRNILLWKWQFKSQPRARRDFSFITPDDQSSCIRAGVSKRRNWKFHVARDSGRNFVVKELTKVPSSRLPRMELFKYWGRMDVSRHDFFYRYCARQLCPSCRWDIRAFNDSSPTGSTYRTSSSASAAWRIAATPASV